MKIDLKKFFVACAKNKETMLKIVKKAGLSIAVLRSIKKGKCLSTVTIGKLADVLGVSVEELIEE